MREAYVLEVSLGIDMAAGASPEAIRRHVRDRLDLALCADPEIVDRHFAADEYLLVVEDGALVARFNVPQALQRQLLDLEGKPVRASTLAQDVVDLGYRLDATVQASVAMLPQVTAAIQSRDPAEAIADIERETGVNTEALRRHIRRARQPVPIGTLTGRHLLDPVNARTNYIRDGSIDIRAIVVEWPTPRAGMKLEIIDAHPSGDSIRALMHRKRVTGHLDEGTPLVWRLAGAAAFTFRRAIQLRVRVIESTTTCQPQALAVDDVIDLDCWLPSIEELMKRSSTTAEQAHLWANDLSGGLEAAP